MGRIFRAVPLKSVMGSAKYFKPTSLLFGLFVVTPQSYILIALKHPHKPISNLSYPSPSCFHFLRPLSHLLEYGLALLITDFNRTALRQYMSFNYAAMTLVSNTIPGEIKFPVFHKIKLYNRRMAVAQQNITKLYLTLQEI